MLLEHCVPEDMLSSPEITHQPQPCSLVNGTMDSGTLQITLGLGWSKDAFQKRQHSNGGFKGRLQTKKKEKEVYVQRVPNGEKAGYAHCPASSFKTDHPAVVGYSPETSSWDC